MQLIRGINKILDRNKFTLAKYEEFLQIISKFKVLPLNEFRNYHNQDEVVIGLRHDSDSQWGATLRMADIERQNYIRSTYFVLHTATYFTNPEFIRSVERLQSRGFEIGLHQDCMKLNCPSEAMHDVLDNLCRKGIDVTGTSAHGDKLRQNIKYWDIFNKRAFGIVYEAYELDHNLYFSDCTFINGHRWHPLDIDWSEIKPGARIQILIHPEIWGNKLYL